MLEILCGAGIGRQHFEDAAGRHRLQSAARLQHGQRTEQPGRVERRRRSVGRSATRLRHLGSFARSIHRAATARLYQSAPAAATRAASRMHDPASLSYAAIGFVQRWVAGEMRKVPTFLIAIVLVTAGALPVSVSAKAELIPGGWLQPPRVLPAPPPEASPPPAAPAA